jgi:tetratricopeptide (TPR) repeat protein
MGEQEGQSEALCYVWNLHALIDAQRGRWCPGIAASDRALRLFGEVGDYNLEAELWQTRSALHICSGDFRGAEACWSQTRELAKRNVNPQLECWSLLDEVETHLGRGATAEAADALEAALAIPTAPTDGGTLIEKHYATAVTRLREGHTAQAIEAADATIAMVSAHPPTGFHWADFTAGAVEVYVDLLERPDLSPADRRSLDRRAARGYRALRRVAWTFAGVRPRSRVLHGRLDWQRGNTRSALRAWRKAEALAVGMDMEFERARARLEILRHGLAGSAEASLREDVLETFARLGATHFLRIAQDS